MTYLLNCQIHSLRFNCLSAVTNPMKECPTDNLSVKNLCLIMLVFLHAAQYVTNYSITSVKFKLSSVTLN